VEEKLERSLRHKSYLIITKYLPHLIAIFYILFTLLGFLDIDAIVLGYFVHISLASWIYFYLNSLIFRYCYVHRLPLYYIALNETISIIDNYVHIPISDFNLLIIHLIFIGILINGYTYYYIRYGKKIFK